MISLTTNAKNALKAGYVGGYNLTIGEEAFTDANILQGSITIEESLCSAEDVDYSRVESNTITLTLINLEAGDHDFVGKTLNLTRTVRSSTVPLGKYTIEETTNVGDYQVTVKAYDEMKKFLDTNIDQWWNETLTFPITVRNLLIQLCTYVGVSYSLVSSWCNSTFSIADRTTFFEGVYASDLLGAIQEISGCFFHTDRTGTLRRVATGVTTAQYTYNLLKEDPEIADFEVPGITAVTIKGSEDDIGGTSGTEGNVYTIIGNVLMLNETTVSLETLAGNILNIIKNKSYVPFSATVVCQPWVEIGDPVSVTTYGSKTASAVLMHRIMSGALLWDDRFIVTGTQERKTAVNKAKQLSILRRKYHELVIDQEQIRSTIGEVSQALDDTSAELKSEILQTKEEVSAKVSKTEVDYQLGQVTVEYEAAIRAAVDAITLEVSRVETKVDENGEDISELQRASANLRADGLYIEDSAHGSSVTRIDGEGMTVLDQGSGEALLTATASGGVEAKRLVSKDGLIIKDGSLQMEQRLWYSTTDSEYGIAVFVTEAT